MNGSVCFSCNGSGWVEDSGTCSSCGGTGWDEAAENEPDAGQ